MSARAPLALIEITHTEDLTDIPVDAVDAVAEMGFEIDLWRAISTLSAREALVVGLVLGIDDRGAHTQVEVADLCGLTNSQVARAFGSGLASLRSALAPGYRSGYAVAA